MRFVHGHWFDGSSFVDRDFYVVDGTLRDTAPAGKVTTVDLHGAYIIPPFGDAHEHNFDATYNTPQVVQQYLRDGVFYAQGVTDVASGTREVVAAKMVNTPQTVDVTYAHTGFTATNGHPKEVYEALALGYYQYPYSDEQLKNIAASHLREGDAYFQVDSQADLDRVWPKFLALKPDLVKIFLSGSEHFAEEDRAHMPLGKGLDPAMVAPIVKKAHAAGLRVTAHVDTAVDAQNAIAGGVDALAHLPGYHVADSSGIALTRLRDEDIQFMAQRHMTVTATASLSDNPYTPAIDQHLTKLGQIDNLSRLRDAGVPVLVGSDHYAEDSTHEWTYLHGLGVWSELDLLRMYAVVTPQAIFPKRKIGQLLDGYEASFLVLTANRLDNWRTTLHVADRWKQGQHIVLTAEPTPK